MLPSIAPINTLRVVVAFGIRSNRQRRQCNFRRGVVAFRILSSRQRRAADSVL